MLLKSWLIIDADFMCHKAMHTFGELSFRDVVTGVIFGYLRDVEDLRSQLQAHGVIHCFNHGRNKRLDMFPEYKKKRKQKVKERTKEELKVWREFDRQRELLKTEYLTRLGYSNVCYQDGYESDDVMAAVQLPAGHEGVIVTSDADLHQCIRHNVWFLNPSSGKRISLQSYTKEHGIHPAQYWKVLTLAGCNTDEVPGIPGVGKKTALAYLKGELPKHYKTHGLIKKHFKDIVQQNKPLVKLPMKGCRKVVPKEDNLSIKQWNKLCDDLGFRSLKKKKGRYRGR